MELSGDGCAQSGIEQRAAACCDCVARMASDTYAELTAIARRRARRYGFSPALEPTALVHEAYIRLANQGRCWTDRARFLAAAARIIKFILVDEARRRAAIKHGGRFCAVDLGETHAVCVERWDDEIDLGDALARLAVVSPHYARVIERRFFCDLSVPETARELRLSPGTVRRHWYEARARLAEWFLAG